MYLTEFIGAYKIISINDYLDYEKQKPKIKNLADLNVQHALFHYSINQKYNITQQTNVPLLPINGIYIEFCNKKLDMTPESVGYECTYIDSYEITLKKQNYNLWTVNFDCATPNSCCQYFIESGKNFIYLFGTIDSTKYDYDNNITGNIIKLDEPTCIKLVKSISHAKWGDTDSESCSSSSSNSNSDSLTKHDSVSSEGSDSLDSLKNADLFKSCESDVSSGSDET